MGTALICFVIAALSLIPLLVATLFWLTGKPDSLAGVFVVWLLPSGAAACFWFFAGMLFVWLQRIRDAIDSTTDAVDSLRQEGIEVRWRQPQQMQQPWMPPK